MIEEEFDEKYLATILERNPHLVTRLPIHPWRWRFLWVWIALFTVLVFIAIRQNRSSIDQIKRDKASIASLERTNCALKEFLVAAEATRVHSARTDTDPVRKQSDIAAAENYHHLAQLFPRDGCANALRGSH